MPHPAAVVIELSDDERTQLEWWARWRTSAPGAGAALAVCVVGGRGPEEHPHRRPARGSIVRSRRSGAHGLPRSGSAGSLTNPRAGRPRTVTDELAGRSNDAMLLAPASAIGLAAGRTASFDPTDERVAADPDAVTTACAKRLRPHAGTRKGRPGACCERRQRRECGATLSSERGPGPLGERSGPREGVATAARAVGWPGGLCG